MQSQYGQSQDTIARHSEAGSGSVLGEAALNSSLDLPRLSALFCFLLSCFVLWRGMLDHLVSLLYLEQFIFPLEKFQPPVLKYGHMILIPVFYNTTEVRGEHLMLQ